MQTIFTNFFAKFQKEIVIALALILLGAGVGSYEKPYNPYENRVNDIDLMMQGVLTSHSQDAATNAVDALAIQGDWANRQTGEQKVIFEQYLEACKVVCIDVYYGRSADTSEMNRLKNELL